MPPTKIGRYVAMRELAQALGGNENLWLRAQLLATAPTEVLDASITVCDACRQRSCWFGEFLCEVAVEADTVDLTVRECLLYGREHPDYLLGRTPEGEHQDYRHLLPQGAAW